MPTQHVDITDPAIHEPKGAAAALVGKSYVTDGAGSGSWEYRTEVITQYIADIGDAKTYYVVVPFAGTITKMYSVIHAAITTTDTVLTPKINTVAVTNGAITVAVSGSAAGIVDDSTPTALNVFAAGDTLELASGGETDATGVECVVTWHVRRNA